MATNVAPRILLIEMPFRSACRPNLGLSLLRACAARAGFECATRYAHFEFARRIGSRRYHAVAEDYADEQLIGDLVFAPALHGVPAGASAGDRACAMPFSSDELASLQESACGFTEALAEELAAEFDVFCFSLMFQRVPSLALARAIKGRAPQRAVVFGGSACEGEMGLVLHQSFPFVDYVCRGEGEKLFPELLRQLRSDGVGRDIRGLVWRENGDSRYLGARAEPIAELDQLPIPNFSDWRLARERHRALDDARTQLPLETSRGCWYGEKHHCTFCGLNGESLSFRQKTPERVIEEVEALAAEGCKDVFAVDLIFPHAYFTQLLPKLAAMSHGLSFFYETKANLSREQLVLLKNAGITQLQPGIESLSTPALKLMRKGVAAYQNIRLLKWAAELNLNVYWNLLYGFYGEASQWHAEMLELVPKLVHLRPPTYGCRRVRIDRFSPLHDDAALRGYAKIRAAPAYRDVYRLPDATLDRLAYHFETSSTRRQDPGIEALKLVTERWLTTAGDSSFVSISSGDALIVIDRRVGRPRRKLELRGIERGVYEACDAGSSAETVAARAELSRAAAHAVLEQLVELGLLLAIDGRYLALAVSMDGVLNAAEIAPALLEAVCHEVYCARMRSMCAPTAARAAEVLRTAP